MNRLTPFLVPIKQNLLALGVFLLIWSTGALWFEDYIIPSPLDVAGCMLTLCDQNFLLHLDHTLARLAVGFLLSFISGTMIGIIAFTAKMEIWIETLMILFQVLPGLVAGIVLLMLFGVGSAVPIALIFMLSTPLIAVNTSRALMRRDFHLELMIRSFHGLRRHLVRDLYLPLLIPTLRANTTLGLVMAFKIVLLGEFLACEEGLGYLLNASQIYFDMKKVFFYILVILLVIVCCQILVAVIYGLFFEKYFYSG